MRRTSIYVLIDPRTNNIRYVGKTVQKLNYRLTQHLSEKSNNKRINWIKNLKKDNLIPIIKEIDFCDWSDSSEKEIDWIKKYIDAGFNLTNMTKGGDGTIGVSPSNETREYMSKLVKEKLKNGTMIPPMLGKTHSIEARKKISKIHKNKSVSDEFREKRRQIMLGSKRSLIAIEKTSKANMKKIVRFSLNMEILQIYNSIKEATLDGFTESKIIDCCKKRSKTYRKFIWNYFEELPTIDKINYEKYKKN